jgi:hypothetical protein
MDAVTLPLVPPGADEAHLIRVNLADFVAALGLSEHRLKPYLVPLLTPFLRLPAGRFAREVLQIDALVASHGLQVAMQQVVARYAGGLECLGADNLPKTGPLLIVANHPGLTDGPALLGSIPRKDVRVVALNRPFLHALPEISRHLFYMSETPKERRSVTLQMVRFLRDGGCLVVFAGGKIEPDPLLDKAASRHLGEWSESATMFSGLVPELQVIPVVIGGVIHPAARKNPIVYLRRQQKDREWLGATLQVIFRRYQTNTVRLVFGEVLTAPTLTHETLLERVREMMETSF